MDVDKVYEANNGGRKWAPYGAQGAACVPNDTRLHDAISQVCHRLQRNEVQASEEYMRRVKPSLDTIVIPEGFPLERMLWKFRDGAIRQIVMCSRDELLEVVSDLCAKIASFQKENPPTREIPKEIETYEDRKRAHALSLIG